MAALAGFLLALNPKNRANQAFALVLVLRALARTTYILGLAVEGTGAAHAWWGVFPVFVILLPGAALYFLASYPEPRWWPRRPGRRAAYLLGSGLLFVALYAAWPTLFWDLSAGTTSPAGPEADALAGPFFVFDTAFLACYALIALVLLKDVDEAGTQRSTSLSLVGVGFGLSAVFGCTTVLAVEPSVLLRHAPALALAVALPVVAAVGLLLWTAGVLARRAWGSGDADERRSARRALTVLPLPAVTMGASLWLLPGGGPAFEVLSAVWNLALPVLVVYGLLRHQLFGIDLKVQWTIKQSTVAAAFISVFFMVSEGAEALLSQQLGTLLGILAAGVLVFAIAPLQRMAERLSTRAVPSGKAVDEMSHDEQADLYRDQLRFAWADGKVDRRERKRLESLRARLGLPEDKAYKLEAELLEDEDAQVVGAPDEPGNARG